MVIVDNSPENFKLQPQNGIFISTWVGDRSDHALRDLGTLLVSMAKEKPKDVRVTLEEMKRDMIEQITF
jgi:TFIIF-interacting CTD phosphatase-like protein